MASYDPTTCLDPLTIDHSQNGLLRADMDAHVEERPYRVRSPLAVMSDPRVSGSDRVHVLHLLREELLRPALTVRYRSGDTLAELQ